MNALEARLHALSPAILAGLRRGIEKESLRVRPDGTLVTTSHPRTLGAALTHPHITTDFSEAQIELITAAHATRAACLDELRHIHQFVYRHIGDEFLWCASMPCKLPDENAIPIARYGTSNAGRFKTLYRVGLSHRYGRRMQLISGLHYNFSLPEDAWPLADVRDANDAYFRLLRNFRRQGWLLLYLFGASPAVCATFVEGREHALVELSPGTLHLPYATSLRMGRLGYLSAAQEALAVSYNDLSSYMATLENALTTPYPAYEAIGIRAGDDYRQLATSLLQIENEFYSTIRPKRVVGRGERPLRALRERGVQYVEVRALDLDPFSPVGITAPAMRFLDVFLLHCLLADSPPDTPQEIAAIGRNKQRVAARGREPGLRLERDGAEVELRQWAGEVLGACAPIAAALDAAQGDDTCRAALAATIEAAANPETLPSARVLAAILQDHGGSYFRFALEHSRRYRGALLAEPLPDEVARRFEGLARQSLDEQLALESADDVPFETYRQRYLAPAALGIPGA